MKGFYSNIFYIRTNVNELKSITFSEHFDIIALTETFLNIDQIDLPDEYKPPDFKLYTRDMRGRGVGSTQHQAGMLTDYVHS